MNWSPTVTLGPSACITSIGRCSTSDNARIWHTQRHPIQRLLRPLLLSLGLGHKDMRPLDLGHSLGYSTAHNSIIKRLNVIFLCVLLLAHTITAMVATRMPLKFLCYASYTSVLSCLNQDGFPSSSVLIIMNKQKNVNSYVNPAIDFYPSGVKGNNKHS